MIFYGDLGANPKHLIGSVHTIMSPNKYGETIKNHSHKQKLSEYFWNEGDLVSPRNLLTKTISNKGNRKGPKKSGSIGNQKMNHNS